MNNLHGKQNILERHRSRMTWLPARLPHKNGRPEAWTLLAICDLAIASRWPCWLLESIQIRTAENPHGRVFEPAFMDGFKGYASLSPMQSGRSFRSLAA
jgi:hypothetical protein